MDDRDCLGQPAAGLLVQHRKRHREVGLVLVPAVLGLGKQHDLRPQVRDAVQDGGHGLPVRAPDRTRRAHHPARRPHALRLRTSSIACGTTLNRSPTTPKSASSKMGASPSLLTATIVLDVCMPARCWIAPEMPSATYNCGETVLPVWPTWNWCG